MIQRLIARRLLKNVATAELLRRAFSSAIRLAPAGVLLISICWLPVVGLGAAAFALGVPALPVEALLGVWSMLVTPLLAALLANAAIRSAGGGRLRIGEVLGAARHAIAPALLPALAVGLVVMLGFGFLVIPGFVLGAVFFVVAPVAAVEKLGVAAAFRRSIELTRGNRMALFGVTFVIGFVESMLYGTTLFFDAIFGFVIAGLVILAVTVLGVLWRASAAALAYADLRTAKEGLEVDALANLLGGAPREKDVALSERGIEEMARRRNVVGRLTGNSIPEGVSLDGVASVRDMAAAAARRDRLRRVAVIAVASVVVVGTLGAGVYGIAGRIQENRRLDQWESDVRAGEAGLADGDPGIERASQAILLDLETVRPERRVELTGRLLAIHADRFYGPGFSAAFATLAKGESGDALITALASQIESNGCNDALTTAKADETNRGRAFSKGCPPNDTSPLDGRRFRPALPLGRAAFAQLLEIRARGRMIESHRLHEATLKILLAGG